MKITVPPMGFQLRKFQAPLLSYSAFGCLAASLLTAPGQLYLDKLYYLKDLGVLVILALFTARATVRQEKIGMLVSAVVGLVFFLFALGVFHDESGSLVIIMMWVCKWGLAAHLGLFMYMEGLLRHLKFFVAILLAIAALDALIGFWEIRTQSYFFEMKADETAAGVAMVKQEHVEDLIRVNGLHRSGTDFGNTMTVGLLLGLFLLLTRKRKTLSFLLVPLLLFFAYDLFFSTVRSFLVGTFAGCCAMIGARFLPRRPHYVAVWVMAGLLAVALFFSYYNIIDLVEFVSKHLLNNVAIGDTNSSYMRLDSWDDVFANIRANPIVAILGAPLASIFPSSAPPTAICDNMFLWVFYHLGVFGLLIFVFSLPAPLAVLRSIWEIRMFYFAVCTQLVVTGIFTDSFFYFSSLLLFFSIGLILAEITVVSARAIPLRLGQLNPLPEPPLEPAGLNGVHKTPPGTSSPLETKY